MAAELNPNSLTRPKPTENFDRYKTTSVDRPIFKPQAQVHNVPNIKLSLPEGDTRKIELYWREVKENGDLTLHVSVSENVVVKEKTVKEEYEENEAVTIWKGSDLHSTIDFNRHKGWVAAEAFYRKKWSIPE